MRRLLPCLSVLSLLLLLLTFGLQLRSRYLMDDLFLIYSVDGSERLSSMEGQLFFQHHRPDEGVRGRPIRVSHRSDRIQSLPPEPWPLRGAKPWWLGVRYFNRPAPSPDAVRKARQAAYHRSTPGPQPLGTGPNAQAARLKWMVQLRRDLATQMSADFFLRRSLPSYWEIVVPIWLLYILFAILPSIWLLAAFRRTARHRRGRCPSCNYDLTGNVSGTCPECGTPAAARAESLR